MVSFPYHSHIFRDFYGSGMGTVWEGYYKGVPLLGVPENPIELLLKAKARKNSSLYLLSCRLQKTFKKNHW